MTLSELRTELRNLAQLYFAGAQVKWAKQSFTVKPNVPLVVLTMMPVTRPLLPPEGIVDGRPVAYYPAKTSVQIDLFANGSTKEIAPGFTPIVENTAEDDLIAFANFLNSPYVTQWCHKRDMAILVPPTVQDVSELIHDTSYEYRAMMEVTVNFTMTAIGYTGTLDPASITQADTGETTLTPEISQTASGGGNADLLSEEADYFTNVEINNKLVKED